jgi:3-dehydroquinate dehydratase-2
MRILVLHGPNLNLLGEREPEIYGRQTLAELDGELEAEGRSLGVEVDCFQSNHEGEVLDRLQRIPEDCVGVVLNPGGWTHTSVALRDAVATVGVPVIEVHLSNTFARESFRKTDLIAPVCTGTILGLGVDGYLAALRVLCRRA